MSQDLWQTGFVYLDVEDPLVAWMVYRGELVSASAVDGPALSYWTADYLWRLAAGDRADRWLAEQHLEQVRATHFAACASRITGFFVFADRESATAARRWGVDRYRDDLCEEVGIRPDSRVTRCDAEWITEKLAFEESEGWMHRYFGGEPCNDDPIWELIVDGTALVYGTEVRQHAYAVVKQTWPRALGLLELARLAAWLDFPLGRTIAMIDELDEGLQVGFYLDFRDAKNPEFLERLETYDGPKNTADLNANTELVLPDLRSRSFTLPRGPGDPARS